MTRLLLVAFLAAACATRETSPRGVAVGIAVADSAGAWCAEFPSDSALDVVPGAIATILFPGDSVVSARRVRIGVARTEQCGTAFPQPRWISYAAFTLVSVDSAGAGPIVGLIAVGDLRVSRSGSALTGDVDGDGTTDEIRRCAADEGEHFTVWSGAPPRVRWHEYFDWGAIVDPTCKAGEDGRDVPK